MKKLLLATLLLIAGATYAQNVGIGTKKPDESAILDLRSSSKGFLLPRLTEKQRNAIPAPAEGLMVYQTGTNQGVYIYESGKWNNLSSLSGAATRFQNATIGTLTPNYLLVGDASGNVASTGIYYNSSSGNIKVNNIDIGTGGGNISSNIGLGTGALSGNSSGYYNVGVGYNALNANTTGYKNNAFGFQALYSNTTGNHNNGFGFNALALNTSGYTNSAFGNQVLTYNTTGGANSAFGGFALERNITGSFNSSFGRSSLQYIESGYGNNAFGIASLNNLTSGNNNISIGDSAAFNLLSGSKNILIGSNVDFPNRNGSNQFVLASSLYGTSIYSDTAKYGINTSNPTATLDINGTLRVRGGSPGAGKVLTSDANGNASWNTLNVRNQVNIMKYVLPSNHTGRGIVNWGSTPTQTIGTAFGYMDAAGVFNVNVAGEYRVTISYSLSGDPDAFMVNSAGTRFLQFSGTQASGLPINGTITDYLSLNAGGQIYWFFNNNVRLNAAGYNSKIIIEKIN